MEPDDLQLIKDYQDGDQKAFETLVSRYLKIVYTFVVRMTGNNQEAQDLTQEVFIKVWKNLDRYTLQSSFKTWSLSIARNTVIDWFRKKKNINFSDLDRQDSEVKFEDNLKDPEPLADEIFERQELAGLLATALDEISPNHRLILVLHLEDELTFEEIAKIVDKPMNTVKSQYRRSLLELRKYLSNNAPK